MLISIALLLKLKEKASDIYKKLQKFTAQDFVLVKMSRMKGRG